MNSGLETYYLITADSNGMRQSYTLHANQVIDIGRAATNRIVLNDDSCSRNHCEVFQTPSGWKVRDRNSRNGTFVNQEVIKQDQPLADGDVIRIGNSLLLFTQDREAFCAPPVLNADSDTATDFAVMDEYTHLPEILFRQKRSSFREEQETLPQKNSRTDKHVSRLFQMALKMANTQSGEELATIVLDGLVGLTGADIGAVLTKPDYSFLLPQNTESSLITASYRSLQGREYRRISRTLSQQVIEGGEAILAKDVAARSDLAGSRDSLDEIQAESLIVAPVMDGKELFGLIHLYSTNPDHTLARDALDYTLAVADQLAVALKNLHQRNQLQEGLKQIRTENQKLRQKLAIESELVGHSEAMQRLRDTIALVSPTDTVVLIRGESGVGKELVARAIHLNSRRKESPFVCMNCAALSESLLESELFGHEKGSFTGATGLKHGKFEQAHKGTLFLDEVGEMSPAIQAKFLRVMEGHPFERVGGANTIQVDVRLVAATNRNLEEAVRELKFRKDLYFRLQVLEIVVPPLRKRGEDIPVLAQFFAERLATKTGRTVRGFTPQAMEKLIRYDWPGNVRELQNTVERAVVLCMGDLVDSQHVQLSQLEPQNFLNEIQEEDSSASPADYTERSIEDLERDHILRTLELTGGNKSKASQILGIERSTLDRKLKKYGRKSPPQS